MSSGYTPGVPRLGVPALLMSDASLGVINPGFRKGDTATALPAGIVLGSSFNPQLVQLARAGGRMIALEARSMGFNVQLAGGINLARDPRDGRNFEYLSEDPLRVRYSRPSRSRGSRARPSSRRSSTTPSTAPRPTTTGWTRSSTRQRIANRTCLLSRSRSSVRNQARS